MFGIVACELYREETCARLANEYHYYIVPPYDYYDVMAGQASYWSYVGHSV